MPYIVTTKRECVSCEQTTTGAPGAGGAAWLCRECGGGEGGSRRAVATLDEAWNIAGTGPRDLVLARERFALETYGRCNVRLPDGTVIEVERVDADTLHAQNINAGRFNGTGAPPPSTIIAAYNAAQA